MKWKEVFRMFVSSLLKWLPFAVVILMVFFTIYASIQQVYRLGANDPQIQIAEDTVARLEAGKLPIEIVGIEKVDMNKSLSPFIVVYGKDKKVVSSGAILDGKDPIPPLGTFDGTVHASASLNSKKVDGGQNLFTWQPKNDLRLASVLISYKDGYVLSARSLYQVEARIVALGINVGIAMLGTLLVSFLTIIFINYQSNNAKELL